MQLKLLPLIFLGVLVAFVVASGWSKLGGGEECKEKLQSLAVADKLNDFLLKYNCPLESLKCINAYKNNHVDTERFGLASVTDADHTFAIEMVCYDAEGVPVYENKTSYMELVADSALKQVTSSQVQTFTFYLSLDAIMEADASFRTYKQSAGIQPVPILGCLASIVAAIAGRSLL